MASAPSDDDMVNPYWLNEHKKATHPALHPSKSNKLTVVKSEHWDAVDNPSDGFCFYYAVLRYIHKSGTNDQQKKYTINYTPLSVTNKENYPAVANLLLNFNLYLNTSKKMTSKIAKALRTNIDNAVMGKGTNIFAGDAYDNEFRDMAEMLGICILIWIFVPTKNKWIWQKETGEDTKCTPQNTMYIFNAGQNHMISLFPRLQGRSVYPLGAYSKGAYSKGAFASRNNMYLPSPVAAKSNLSQYNPSEDEAKNNFIAQMKIYLKNIKKNIENIDDKKLESLYIEYTNFNEDNFGFEDKTEDFINEFILKLKSNDFKGGAKSQRVTKRHQRTKRQRGTKRQRVTKRHKRQQTKRTRRH